MQMATGYMMAAVLQTVTRLGVADQLDAGPLSVNDLARRTGTNGDALYRVLRPLIATGVFAEPSPKTIALTPVSELLRSGAAGLRDMLMWVTSRFHFHVWAELEHSV